MRLIRRGRSCLLASALLVCGACGDLPRDPNDSLEDARGGVLRVGVSASPPWVTETDPVGGREAALVRSFAASIGARVEWVWGGAEENLARLEHGELHIVAAGLTGDSPWNGRVALTRPHARTGRGAANAHVLATAPGENALLVALERHIRSGR